jgi:O-antigen/teichoic acid export membrane protein
MLLTLDTFLAKAMVADDVAIGYYMAASTVSRVPYFLLSALAIVILPSVSRAFSLGQHGEVSTLVRQALRVVTICCVPAVAMMAIAAERIIAFLYSDHYAEAAVPLSVLVVGMSLLALFYVMANVEVATGHERRPAAIAAIAICVGCLLGNWLIPAYGSIGAALVSATMGSVACLIVLFFVIRRSAVAFPWSTLARSLVATAPGLVVLQIVPAGSLSTPVSLVLAIVSYLGCLVATGEIRPGELRFLTNNERIAGLLDLREDDSVWPSHQTPSRASRAEVSADADTTARPTV